MLQSLDGNPDSANQECYEQRSAIGLNGEESLLKLCHYLRYNRRATSQLTGALHRDLI